MTTPFWLPQNRGNFTRESLLTSRLDKLLGDSKRDLTRTHFNGKALLEHLISALKIDAAAMSKSEQITLVREKASGKHLSTILRRELLSEWCDELSKQKYIEKLIRILYQWGLIWAATQSLIESTEGAEAGYLIRGRGLLSSVSICAGEDGDQILIDETVHIKELCKLNGFGVGPVLNQDGSPIMAIKNQFELTLIPFGNIQYKHTSLDVQLNGPLARENFSKRQLMDEITLSFNSICRKYRMVEFTPEEHEHFARPA